MDIKMTLMGFEKEMRLIDKADSLIRELKKTTSELSAHTFLYPEITREGENDDGGESAN